MRGYEEFLASKQIDTAPVGFEPGAPMAPALFDLEGTGDTEAA